MSACNMIHHCIYCCGIYLEDMLDID